MITVSTLIEALKNFDPNEPIVYQFFTKTHTDLTKQEFAEVAEYINESITYNTDTRELFDEWVSVALDAIENEKAGN